jgi:hypothetical protein
MISASVGWSEVRKGERIAGDTRSMPGYAVRSRAPVIAADWDTEQRFARSRTLSSHGVRSSVCALVGDPGSPFGVLTVHLGNPSRYQRIVSRSPMASRMRWPRRSRAATLRRRSAIRRTTG